jgi:hypothetical protein
MSSKAKAASRDLGNGGVFIDHATLVEDDLTWLANFSRLTLWNVSVPPDFLRQLPLLWWIDWRGGNAGQGVTQIETCTLLRYVSLNQIRALTSLNFLENLHSLEMLNLYGLSKVDSLPSMKALMKLRRIHIGQMKSLLSIGPVLEAPQLEELQLLNWVGVSASDVEAMQNHLNLRAFEWFGANIPDKMWVPVRDAVGLPLTKAMHPEEWFALPE